MEKKTLVTGISLLALLTPIIHGEAQTNPQETRVLQMQARAQKMTKELLFQTGVFYPNYVTEGKYFYNGRWNNHLFQNVQEANDFLDTILIPFEDRVAMGETMFPKNQFLGFNWQQHVDLHWNGNHEAAFAAYGIPSTYANSRLSEEEIAASAAYLHTPEGTQIVDKLTQIAGEEVKPVADRLHNMLTGKEEPGALSQSQVEEAYATLIESNRGENLAWINFQDVDTTGLNLGGAKGLGNSNITGTQLSNVSNLTGADLSEADLTGFNPTGKSLSNVNLSNSIGLDPNVLSNATSLERTVLSGVDLSEWDTTGTNLYRTNLNGSNITGEQLTKANSIQKANLSGLDLTGLDFTGKFIQNTDLSNTTGADFSTLPPQDLTGTNFTNTDLSTLPSLTGRFAISTNFSNATGITAQELNQLENWNYANFTGLDLTGIDISKGFDGVNLSNTTGITGSTLKNAGTGVFGLRNMTLQGIDMSGFSALGKTLMGTSFQGTSNLNAQMFEGVTSLNHSNFTGTGISRQELEYWSGQDVSSVTGLIDDPNWNPPGHGGPLP